MYCCVDGYKPCLAMLQVVQLVQAFPPHASELMCGDERVQATRALCSLLGSQQISTALQELSNQQSLSSRELLTLYSQLSQRLPLQEVHNAAFQEQPSPMEQHVSTSDQIPVAAGRRHMP